VGVGGGGGRARLPSCTLWPRARSCTRGARKLCARTRGNGTFFLSVQANMARVSPPTQPPTAIHRIAAALSQSGVGTLIHANCERESLLRVSHPLPSALHTWRAGRGRGTGHRGGEVVASPPLVWRAGGMCDKQKRI